MVGPNASGKTNLLEALRWVTLNKNVGGDSIERWDFHNGKTENAIRIEAEIIPPIKHGDTFNKFSEVAVLRLEAKEYKVRAEKGSIRCDHPALTAGGKRILTKQAIPLAKGRVLTDDEKGGRQTPHPLLVREIKDQLPIYYFDNAVYGFHLTMNRGSLLSRLARTLHEDLSRDANRIEWRGKECTRAEAIADVLEDLAKLLKTNRATELLEKMASFMASQLQVSKNSLALEIGLPQGLELLRKLELLARDNTESPILPMDRLGRGYSALGILALFRALNELDDQREGAIVLIEEPEMFLGPHLRSLYAGTLQEFARKGNQVVVVTHSAEFFDPLNPESAVLVRKVNSSTKCVQWPKGTPTPSFDATLKFIEPNLNRLVLSRKLLFVEGDDDYAAVKAALDLLLLQPAFCGLEVLRLGGKGNIVHLVPYTQKFGISHATLLDADAKGLLSKVDPSGSTWRIFDPDLEGALNTTKESPNSIHITKVVLSHGSWTNLEKACPAFARPLKQCLAFLEVINNNT